MRMLLKAVLDTKAVSEDIRSGVGGEAIDRLQEVLQPEAVYFFGEDGQRTVLAVFDLADPSQIPVVTEPLYQGAKAKVTLTPCMNLEDVKRVWRRRPAGWLICSANQCAESREPTPAVMAPQSVRAITTV